MNACVIKHYLITCFKFRQTAEEEVGRILHQLADSQAALNQDKEALAAKEEEVAGLKGQQFALEQEKSILLAQVMKY